MTSLSSGMSLPDWGRLLLLALVWGGSFFFIAVAVRDLPPLTIVTTRLALAAILLLVIARLAGVAPRLDPGLWGAFLIMGLLNNIVPFCLIVWGQTHIASGVASILNATTPLFGIVAAHFLTRDEKMTPARFAGVIAGLSGVAVMVGGAVLRDLGTGVLAQLAILGAALSYALAGIYGRRFRAMNIPPLATAAGQVTASCLVLAPATLLIDQPWTLALPGVETLWALAGLATVSTALAYVLYFRILATAGATNILLVTFLIPVSAIILGALFLGEVLQPRHLAGMALIGAGLAIMDGRPLRWIAGRMGRRSRA